MYLQWRSLKYACVHARVCPRLISEKPAESHTVEVSVVEVHNNEVFDLLVPDDGGQRRDVVNTSSGSSQVTSLTYE